jgi:2,4-diaminopentanoate dehydrogenase
MQDFGATAVSGCRRRYRVIQWGTGVTGSRSLKAIIEHPLMDLVGLWVHSADKVGRDAGDLCGAPLTGVTATNSLDDLCALDADCVVYMPQGFFPDEICKILASGKNIATSRFETNNPPTMPDDLRGRIEAACLVGGTSLYGTGSSPGFISEALPITLLSVQRRLDCLTIDEFADMREYDSPDTIFRILGYGQPPESFDAKRMADVKEGFAHSLELLAAATGIVFDEVRTFGEVATARKRIELHGGVIEPGTIAALRVTIAGCRGGKPIMQMRTNWYCSRDVEPAWDLRDIGWRVLIEGDAPMDIAITNPVPKDLLSQITPNKTPFRVVNSIPMVCAAPPGIRTTLDLPQIVPFLGSA